jgi:hypothetical protein
VLPRRRLNRSSSTSGLHPACLHSQVRLSS